MRSRSHPRQRTLFDQHQRPLFGRLEDSNSEITCWRPAPPALCPAWEAGANLPRLPPPLVAPDRQVPINLDEMAEGSLPPLTRQKDAIAIDRLRTDIDGPPHRFTICLGDCVEVFCAPEQVRIGNVVDICHERREVRVAFSRRGRGEWFPVQVIFPVPVDLHAAATFTRRSCRSRKRL